MARRIVKTVAAAYTLAAAGLAGGAAVGYDTYEDYQHAAATSAIIRADIQRLMPLTRAMLQTSPPAHYAAAPNFVHGMFVTPAEQALTDPSADIADNCAALRSLYQINADALAVKPDETRRAQIARPAPARNICMITAP